MHLLYLTRVCTHVAVHSNKLYASMHLNFISKLERRLMEDLARLVVEAGSVQTIAKVTYYY